MEFFSNLHLAFDIALEPTNLLLCFLGCVIGTFVGVLPGLGPAASISLLLPITYKLSAVQAIIMLGGLYYGTMYGGSTTSILINVPGEAASVVTCLDGYQMACKGRAGPALGIAAFGSFIAGTVSTILIMVLAPPLSTFALKFGPPEFVGLVFLGLTMVTYLSGGSMAKALMMAVVGLLLGCIGTDIVSGRERFTLGINTLAGGLEIVPIIMGLFGISEVLLNVERSTHALEVFQTKITGLLPTRQDWKDSSWPIARGSVLGFLIGLIPGGGGTIAAFMSYAMEKRIAKGFGDFREGRYSGRRRAGDGQQRRRPGKLHPFADHGDPLQCDHRHPDRRPDDPRGHPRAPAAGRPPPGLLGGRGQHVHGERDAPASQPSLDRDLGQIPKNPLRHPLPVHFFVLPDRRLYGGQQPPRSLHHDPLRPPGYLMKKYGYEPAPLVLAFVLAPMFENAFRQSLIISDSSPVIFFTRPIAAFFIIFSLLLLVSPLILIVFGRKRPGLLVKEE